MVSGTEPLRPQPELSWFVAAACLGLGIAGLSVINATPIAGAGFDTAMQARKLSVVRLSLPSGQVLGLATVAALNSSIDRPPWGEAVAWFRPTTTPWVHSSEVLSKAGCPI